jgi:two-component system, NarL family, nitrate/nitrite response regulator NarL
MKKKAEAPNKLRIMLVDDHNLFIDGLKTLLSLSTDLEVIVEANNGEEMLRKLRLYYIDLILLDIQMPLMNGIDAVKQIKEHYPNISVIMLSMHDELSYVKSLYDMGVEGYLLKNTNQEELLTAIRKVADGGRYFSPDLISSIMQAKSDPEQVTMILTRREREIIALIAQEYNNGAIADKLNISQETVNSHRKNLLRKLNVKNTAGLVKYALQIQLI